MIYILWTLVGLDLLAWYLGTGVLTLAILLRSPVAEIAFLDNDESKGPDPLFQGLQVLLWPVACATGMLWQDELRPWKKFAWPGTGLLVWFNNKVRGHK